MRKRKQEQPEQPEQGAMPHDISGSNRGQYDNRNCAGIKGETGAGKSDAIVCEGELTVNESLVTGEPNEIRKVTGDHILSGSFVISGRAKAQLEKVGDASFAARLSKNAKQIKKK